MLLEDPFMKAWLDAISPMALWQSVLLIIIVVSVDWLIKKTLEKLSQWNKQEIKKPIRWAFRIVVFLAILSVVNLVSDGYRKHHAQEMLKTRPDLQEASDRYFDLTTQAGMELDYIRIEVIRNKKPVSVGGKENADVPTQISD